MTNTDELVSKLSSKKKTKKESTMKKTILIVVSSVIVTLLVVASFAVTFRGGASYQRSQDSKVKAQASDLVKSVSLK